MANRSIIFQEVLFTFESLLLCGFHQHFLFLCMSKIVFRISLRYLIVCSPILLIPHPYGPHPSIRAIHHFIVWLEFSYYRMASQFIRTAYIHIVRLPCIPYGINCIVCLTNCLNHTVRLSHPPYVCQPYSHLLEVHLLPPYTPFLLIIQPARPFLWHM